MVDKLTRPNQVEPTRLDQPHFNINGKSIVSGYRKDNTCLLQLSADHILADSEISFRDEFMSPKLAKSQEDCTQMVSLSSCLTALPRIGKTMMKVNHRLFPVTSFKIPKSRLKVCNSKLTCFEPAFVLTAQWGLQRDCFLNFFCRLMWYSLE